MTFQATVVQKKLQDAGFDAGQAFSIASVLETDVVADLDERLVTRDHFDAKWAELRAEMTATEARIDKRMSGFDSKLAAFEGRMAGFDAKLSDLKAEMIKWMVGIAAGSTLTIVLTMLRLVK